MTARLNTLIEALRQELQQYGEMLALLDQQQDLVVRRDGVELMQCVARIEDQAKSILDARFERQCCQTDLAQALNLPAAAAFQDLLPRLPDEYQPLVRALVEENNRLLVRVHQRSRQNHLLLSRSVDLMQRLIHTLLPTAYGASYTPTGAGLGRPALEHSLFSAVG